MQFQSRCKSGHSGDEKYGIKTNYPIGDRENPVTRGGDEDLPKPQTPECIEALAIVQNLEDSFNTNREIIYLETAISAAEELALLHEDILPELNRLRGIQQTWLAEFDDVEEIIR